MLNLQDMSIRRKQMWVIMLTCSVALLLACVSFIAYDTLAFRREMVENLSSLAEVVGRNTTAAIDFDDTEAASQTLMALSGEPSIVQAHVHPSLGGLGGGAFASYLRNGAERPPDVELSGTTDQRFSWDHLYLVRPITEGDEQIGAIELVASLDGLKARFARYVGIVGAVLVVSLLVAFWLSIRLQRLLTAPILELASAARQVAANKDYSIRVSRHSDNELGRLADRFNEMLAGIQERDSALQAARDTLEQRVAERTCELDNSLSLLHATVDSTADGILALDQSGKLICFNKKFITLWAFPPEMVVKADPEEMMPFCARQLIDSDGFLERFRALKVHPESGAFDVLEFEDGRVFELYANPTHDSDAVGVVLNFHDISERKRAEEETRKSQALYLSLVEQLPAGIFRKDKEGRYVFVNPWFCKLKAMKPDEIVGRFPREVASYEQEAQHSPFQDASKFAVQGESHHETIMRTGNKIEQEEEYPCENGDRLYFHAVKLPVFDAGGEIVGTQGILFDVTQRKQMEAELASERDLLRTLMDNLPDTIYFKDLKSCFVRVSKSKLNATYEFYLQQYAATHTPGDAKNLPPYLETVERFGEYLKGKSDFDFFTKEDAQLVYNEEQKIICTGQPLIGQLEHVVRCDGSARWYLSTKMPWKDEHGNIIGTFGTSKDVTELKEAEAELAYERHLLRTLLDTCPDAIYFKDQESRFIRCSKSMARLFRVGGPNELVGKRDFDFFQGEHAVQAFEEEQEIIRTGQPIIGKTEREMMLDGRSSWVLTSKLPLRNVQGEIIGTFGISKDITAIKETEAKLQAVHHQLVEASRQAGMAEVATSVLHNVGNVLNSVNTSASVIRDQLRHSKTTGIMRVAALFEENRENLGEFLTQPGRVDQLLTYLKSLAQQLELEQGKIVSEVSELTENIEHIKEIVAMQQSYAKVAGVTETVSVADLVEDSLRMNSGALIRHGVQLVREFAPVPPVTVEKHKVLQILVNLIRNAKYACDDSGRGDKQLTLRVANGDRTIKISVSDNGVGITPENLTRIFSHGFTTRQNGHGFGLHSGALAAREMGGSLSVHSEGAGTGATFTLELPLEPKSIHS